MSVFLSYHEQNMFYNFYIMTIAHLVYLVYLDHFSFYDMMFKNMLKICSVYAFHWYCVYPRLSICIIFYLKNPLSSFQMWFLWNWTKTFKMGRVYSLVFTMLGRWIWKKKPKSRKAKKAKLKLPPTKPSSKMPKSCSIFILILIAFRLFGFPDGG